MIHKENYEQNENLNKEKILRVNAKMKYFIINTADRYDKLSFFVVGESFTEFYDRFCIIE